MIDFDKAKEMLKTKYPDENPYCCVEFKDRFAFSFPDGASAVRVVNKKTGDISIESGLKLDLTKDVIGIHNIS